MKSIIKGGAAALCIGAGIAGTADADVVTVSSNITTSTTWVSTNTYVLQDQIYVEDGVTLTIEPGVVIQGEGSAEGIIDSVGSLAVVNGGMIIASGTASDPIIFTSNDDVATWDADGGHPTGGDPTSGTWRETALEWGNLTLMGDAFIAEDATIGNTAVPSTSNTATMEGLDTGPTFDSYGGGDDDYDAGSLEYVSLRYGGLVLELQVELNGLSMGGIGRDTDVNHIEIMNNVDDGIETWGGTVNYKNVAIWNVGDDSFDVDQGWRGKAQFVLIVQGNSLDASQGSGVGDNCFEVDGAEDSDYQPVTTAAIYNATVIGQPVDGDGGTAWRDNARVQYRNCVFMDLGERLVRFDNLDGDGANGYGFNGTLSWADTWTTDWSETSTVNPFPGSLITVDPLTDYYRSQVDGKLAEITDSVFFRNLASDAYTEATARGVLPGNGTNNNVLIPGDCAGDAPIMHIRRGSPVIKGGKVMLPVLELDPRARNEAATSVGTAPSDGFFTAAAYRGAFDSTTNWLLGWTAADAFGMTMEVAEPDGFCTTGVSCPLPGTSGALPVINASGSMKVGAATFTVYVDGLPPAISAAWMTFGVAGSGPLYPLNMSAFPGTAPYFPGAVGFPCFQYMDLLAQFTTGDSPKVADANGTAAFTLPIPADGTLAGLPLSWEGYAWDSTNPGGLEFSTTGLVTGLILP